MESLQSASRLMCRTLFGGDVVSVEFSIAQATKHDNIPGLWSLACVITAVLVQRSWSDEPIYSARYGTLPGGTIALPVDFIGMTWENKLQPNARNSPKSADSGISLDAEQRSAARTLDRSPETVTSLISRS
jgi:hypothetical protein